LCRFTSRIAWFFVSHTYTKWVPSL
jgi:hypothetical protein